MREERMKGEEGLEVEVEVEVIMKVTVEWGNKGF